MKIAFFNRHAVKGGAAIATSRLFRGILDSGVNAKFFHSHDNISDETYVDISSRGQFTTRLLNNARLFGYKKDKSQLFSQCLNSGVDLSRFKQFNPDIINMFWMGDSFLSIKQISAFTQPVVWTLHDMWPLTGGCHYDLDCGRFQFGCGFCPILKSDRNSDLSKLVFQRKLELSKINLTLVATSMWMKSAISSSPLFYDRDVELIYNGFDVDYFSPLDKDEARSRLSLDQSKKYILFTAHNPNGDQRKGLLYLAESLKYLEPKLRSDLTLLVVGSEKSDMELGENVIYFEHTDSFELQKCLYSASDVLIAPSVQENLSNAVIEAQLCGLPTIAFEIGGMRDIIMSGLNGILAPTISSRALAKSITDYFIHPEFSKISSVHARRISSTKFCIRTATNNYLDLYHKIYENIATWS